MVGDLFVETADDDDGNVEGWCCGDEDAVTGLFVTLRRRS